MIFIYAVSLYRNIDDVDKTMDEINEQTENMKQIQEALSAPIGAAADFDEVVIFSMISFCIIDLVLSIECLLFKFSFSVLLWSTNSAAKICYALLSLQDELEAELEELEGFELEEQLLQPATTTPAAPVQVPAGPQPAHRVPQKRTAEEDELAALQAEMAL